MNNCSTKKNWGVFLSIFIFFVVFGVLTFNKVDTEAAVIRTGVVKAGSLNVRTGAGTNYSKLKYNNAYVSLKKGAKISITSESASWYKISFTYSKKLLTGYVNKQYVSVSLPTTVYEGTVTASVLNVRKSNSTSADVVKDGNKKVQLKKNETVDINKSVGGWYNIDFKYNGKEKSGYVIDDYIKKTTYAAKVTTNNVYLRKGADTSCDAVKVNNKNVKLAKNTSVTILAEAGSWYYLETKYAGKKIKGYTYSSYVKKTSSSNTSSSNTSGSNTTNSSTNSATTGSSSDSTTEGTTIASVLNVRKDASLTSEVLTSSGKKVQLLKDTNVTILSEKNDWYYVQFKFNGTTLKGYVVKQYVKIKGANSEQGCYGIDVSQYQNTIDWAKVKASGIEYAIIRATKYSSKGEKGTNLVKDSKFDTNMKNAIAAGVKVGVYVYSYANSSAQAAKEAELVLEYVKNYKLTYPIYYDIEEASRQKTSLKTENTNFCKAFCDKVVKSGYKAGVYTGASFFNAYLNISSLSAYDIWVARYIYSGTYVLPSKRSAVDAYVDKTYMYNTSSGLKNKYTNLDADMWQFTSNGQVNGISGKIDMNFSYKCY